MAIRPTDDTVVVASNDEAFFRKVFLNENRWYEVQIDENRLAHLKYLAIYRTSPISAITHYAPISSIEVHQTPQKDFSTRLVMFSAPATEINSIPYVKDGDTVQGRRYTSLKKLLKARNMNEVFSEPEVD